MSFNSKGVPILSSASVSFWLKDQKRFVESESLNLPKQFNGIAIVGAGLSGLSTAYWLIKKGIKDIIIIESRGVAGGATGRNGGHLWPCKVDEDAFVHPPHQYIKQYGQAETQKLYQFDFGTVKLMNDFVASNDSKSNNNINCDLNMCGSISLARTKEEADNMINYYNEMKKYKLDQGLEFWDKEKTKKELKNSNKEDFLCSIFQRTAGSIWAAKFAFQLADFVEKNGVKIYTNTEVISYENKNNAITLKTAKGDVKVSKVVFALNGYTNSVFSSSNRKDWFYQVDVDSKEKTEIVRPVRGQIILTSPLKTRWNHCISWEKGLGYMIQREDGRVIIGGMRQHSGFPKGYGCLDDSVTEESITKALFNFLIETFPHLKDEGLKIEQVWTGIMGYSKDGNPIVGPVPNTTNEYVLAGFSGHGMPRCFGCGKAIAELITGELKTNDFIKAFDPKRYSVKSKL